ncbi:hypothetical protein [Paratissierella segnis]|uniref:Uncharacterized protein n=1 Tax=Paratissierella segnis TaxID=2763679 RepID=A0A926EQV5_9FIRM|nr:hypothetical protein [Paratissierella segnis]MBC8588063.1 hypothetical protein [Paratissierella segnis]
MSKVLKKTSLNNIRFKIIEFLDRKRLLGVHRKCWANLVVWSIGATTWGEIPDAICSSCHYCHPAGYERDR